MDSENKKQLTLTRIFNAPREHVWSMFTEPEHFVKWYGLSNSTMSDLKMDVREGGGWSGIMRIPGYPDISWLANYTIVMSPEKLVFALRNPDNHKDVKVEMITIILKELDSKTEMFFNQSGNLPDDEYQKALRDGWTSFFNRLEKVLEEDK